MSLHYGLWDAQTRNFVEALQKTNEYMAGLVGMSKDKNVLDAGCGVGGAAIYLAKQFRTQVTGLSLSELQVETARQNALKHSVDELVAFELKDFTNTGFADQSFDVIWACESSSSASNKEQMLKEWHRLLRPGGKIVLLDFFKFEGVSKEGEILLDKWSDLWAMSSLISVEKLSAELDSNGFKLEYQENLSKRIEPTIRWMYKSYLLGSLPARLYNLFFGARRYSRNHYKSGLYQQKTYKLGLWQYHAILAVKK